MPNDPFVEAAALASLGPVRYLDARDQAAFDAGHAPGAVRVPLDAWDKAAKAADIGFETTAFWDDALGALGLDPSGVAVTYDTGAMTNAARVWFVLQYFGLKCVIVNGGWPALAAASGAPKSAEPSTAAVHAHPGAGAVGVVDRVTLKAQLNGAAHVFDSPHAEGIHRRGLARPAAERTFARRAASVARGPDGPAASSGRRRICAACWRALGSDQAIIS